MTPPEQVIARVFNVRVSELAEQSSPDTVAGWDSLAHMTLVFELEKEYDISIAPGDVIDMVNVRVIKEILHEYGVDW